MTTMNPTTGHSPRGERKIAGVLYISIAAAVIAALVFFFIASGNKELSPYKADRPEAVAPDVPPNTQGDRSGAVANPLSEPPTSNPSNQNQ